jgi:hypothetical protein
MALRERMLAYRLEPPVDDVALREQNDVGILGIAGELMLAEPVEAGEALEVVST